MCGAFATIGAALFLSTGAPCAAPGYGLPTDRLVTSWSALPTTRVVPWAGAGSQVKMAKAHVLDAAPPAGVLDEAFASSGDDQGRRDLALYEMATSWPQSQRTALFDARDARRRYVAAAAKVGPAVSDTSPDERFAALAAQVADGTGRSATIDDRAIDGEMANALRGARARVDAPRRAEVEASQTAWLAYRDAMVAFADVKSPGLTPTIRGEMTTRRARVLEAIGR